MPVRKVRSLWQLWLVATLSIGASSFAYAQDTDAYELPPINYSHAQPQGVVEQLKSEIATNGWHAGKTDRETVRLLLRRLNIPEVSQLLVFSKTSFQLDRITPLHPRALYYGDNCYVGWVPGGLVEIAAIDAKLGPVFYSFDPRPGAPGTKQNISRGMDCLRCHGGAFIPGLPALLARSVFADENGEPLYRQGTELVDYSTPFSKRWGGWYVTGKHGNSVHRGNGFASENGDQLVFNAAAGANVTNLTRYFDTGNYLNQGSDIIALLVFEYQTAVQNIITAAGISCRRGLEYQKSLQRELKQEVGEEPVYDSVRHIFDSSAKEVVDALLFKDEAELPDGIVGAKEFSAMFSKKAPHDAVGDSLKDLLVSDHLFKNRCSYLIYSDAFLALPKPLRNEIYQRLDNALRLQPPDPRYTYIHTSERRRILAILKSTHAEFRDFLRSNKSHAKYFIFESDEP